MLIEEPIGAGVLGLLATWVRGSTETITATKTTATANEMAKTSLDLNLIQELLILQFLFLIYPAVREKWVRLRLINA
jgi:mannose/fructose/N-acetylgalactosamine-specific phosphotransferase system component IID